jgi:hypothetical protein
MISVYCSQLLSVLISDSTHVCNHSYTRQYYQRFEGTCCLHLMFEVTQLLFLTIIINF